jgi:hypothetical protein
MSRVEVARLEERDRSRSLLAARQGWVLAPPEGKEGREDRGVEPAGKEKEPVWDYQSLGKGVNRNPHHSQRCLQEIQKFHDLSDLSQEMEFDRRVKAKLSPSDRYWVEWVLARTRVPLEKG